MTNRSINLALSILITFSPLAGAVGPQEARPAATATRTSAPAASGPGALIGQVQSGTAAGIRALNAAAGPHADVVRAVVASPALLSEPAFRDRAVAALGEAEVARLEAAVAALPRQDAGVAAALAEIPRVSEAQGKAALLRLMAEADAWKTKDPGSVAGSDSSSFTQTLSKPSRLKSAVAGLAMLIGAGAAVPAASQPLLTPAPAVLTQQTQGVFQKVRFEQAGVVEAANVQDMLAKFDPKAQLYLVNNPNISAGEVAQLKAAVAGKQWTIVIVGDSEISGNKYVNRDGDTFHGKDAVQWAVNEGLFKLRENVPVDAQGQRTDASLFFIQRGRMVSDGNGGQRPERVINVRGSDAMHAFGLVVEKKNARYGDRVWPGDLDVPLFISPYKSNGLVAAVRSTVDGLDQMYSTKLAAKVDSAKTALASAKSAYDQLATAQADFAKRHAQAAAKLGLPDLAVLKDALAAAQRGFDQHDLAKGAAAASDVAAQANAALQKISSFDRAFAAIEPRVADAVAAVKKLDEAAAAFRSQHPKATGDLAAPKTADMKDAIAAAQKLRETDPQSAGARLDTIVSEARFKANAMLEAGNGAARIAEAQKLRKEVAGRAYADSASDDLLQSEQLLRSSDEDLRAGNAKWLSELNDGRRLIDQAEAKITAAAEQAAADARMHLILGLILGFLTLGIGFFLNRRFAAPARRKALEELKPWDAKFAVQDDAVIDNVTNWLLKNSEIAWQGRTKTVIEAMRQEAGASNLRNTKVREVYAKISSLVHPAWYRADIWVPNLIGSWNYTKAENLLTKDEIEVSLEARKQDWKEKAFGSIDNFKPFKTTFKALFEDYNAHGLKAAAAKEQVENARAATATIADDIAKAVKAVSDSKATITNPDGQFQAAAVFEKGLPQAEELVKKSVALKDFDPVGAMEAGGTDATRIAADSKALIEAIAAARAGALAKTAASAADLNKAGVDTGWVAAETARLSQKSDELAAGILAGSQAEGIKALTQGLDAAAAKAADAAEGAKALTAQRARIVAGEKMIADARERASKALNIPSDKLLVEKDNNPSEELVLASDAGDRALKLLSKGDLGKAKAAVTEMQNAVDAASQMVGLALRSLDSHAQMVKDLASAGSGIKDRIPEATRVLESIRADFAPSVLKLDAGDASHPSANGTIDDNIDETNVALDAAADKLKKSETAFASGQLVRAGVLLEQIKAHHSMADDRLKEILEKRARLDKAVADNTKKAAELKGYEAEVKGFVDDKRTMAPTMTEFGNVQKQLAKAYAGAAAKKGDPFQAAQALSAAADALMHVRKSTKNDWDLFAHAQNNFKTAYDHLDEAGKYAQQLQKEAGNTPLVQRVFADLQKIGDDYERGVKVLEAAHGDWNAADHLADQINAATAKTLSYTKNAIQQVESANEAISRAAGDVRGATTWTKRGHRVPGSPGSSELEYARRALGQGNYDEAQRYAQAASAAAAAAIAELERVVRREIEAEEEAERERQRERRRREEEEEARRRRSEEDSRSSSSGSSWGGSSSSGGDSSSWGSSSSSGGDSSSF